MKRFVWLATAIALGTAGLAAQSKDNSKDKVKSKEKTEAVVVLEDDDDEAPDLMAGLLAELAELQEVPVPPPPPPPASPDIRVFRFDAFGTGSYLGVGIAEVDTERAKALKLSEERGVEITRVDENSPAAQAGLKENDVVLEFNSVRIEGVEQFGRMVRETPPGRKVKLLISRNGQTQTLVATIGDRRVLSRDWEAKMRQNMDQLRESLESQRFHLEMPDIPSPFVTWHAGLLGIEAEKLNPQLAEFFGVKRGVLVRSVNKDSAAEKAGLKAGDVITKVDGEEVASPGEVTAKLRQIEGGKSVPLTVVRGRAEMVLHVVVDSQQSGRRKIIVPRTPAQPQAVRPARPVVAPGPAPRTKI